MKANGVAVMVSNVMFLFLMEYFEVVTSSPFLTCYSCVYDPTVSERVLVRRSPLARLRHGGTSRTTSPWSYTIQSEWNKVTASLIARRHNERYVINTESCNILNSRGVQMMPSRICPKIPGYFEFCNREYVFRNKSRLVYVSRDCHYVSSRDGRSVPSLDILDTFTKQTRVCKSFLCNDDTDTVIHSPPLESKSKFANNGSSDLNNDRTENSQQNNLIQKPSGDARTLGYVISRGKRLSENQTGTLLLGNQTDQLDIADDVNMEAKRAHGNVTRKRGDDMEQIDEDAENDDEDNYYNADGSGINIELSRYFPTGDPPSTAVKMAHLNYLILASFVRSFL